jgi:RNA polymerase sigma factor (sigma-70 family)
LTAEATQALAAFDRAHEIKRGPTQRHQDDPPEAFGGRAICSLVETFRRLMQTDAECLCSLEVSSDVFRKQPRELRSLIAKLTCLDMDLCPERPRLGFEKLLANAEFQRAHGLLKSALQALVQQLETYPAAVMRRPEPEPTREGQSAHRRSGLSRQEANRRVQAELEKKPNAKSADIARTIGCSEGCVRGTPAWKQRPGWRSRGKPLGAKVGLDIADERKAEEEWQRQRKAADGDAELDHQPQELKGRADEEEQDQASRRGLNSRLAAALDRLPDDQRKVVELRHLQEYSVAAVSKLTGRSAASVKDLLRQGLSTLREQLEGAGADFQALLEEFRGKR